jgi:hypothetical protein
MNDPKDKSAFDWKDGATLDEESYAPLGNVKAKGLPKIGKAIAADPVVRKKEREAFVAAEQQKPYVRKAAKDEPLIIEESASGLTSDIENSEARKLIDPKNTKFKGVERFGKK